MLGWPFGIEDSISLSFNLVYCAHAVDNRFLYEDTKRGFIYNPEYLRDALLLTLLLPDVVLHSRPSMSHLVEACHAGEVNSLRRRLDSPALLANDDDR